jgi:CD109 antigen
LENFPFLERHIEVFDGVADFFFSMSDLYALSGASSLDELEVYVKAAVIDPYFDDKVNGSFITTLYDPRIKLKFLGKQPRAFKPNAPYTTFVAVYQQDGTPLPYERAINSYVRIRVETTGQSSFSNQSYIPIGPQSIVSYTFTPEPGTQFISISAILGENGNEDPASMITERAISYRSPSNSYIHVTSSTIMPQVGDYMIFTVKVSQPVDHVFYHIISSSRIIFTDVLTMHNKQKTFDVGLTREMAPSAHIVAYYVRYDGELVADSYNFHVNASSVQNQVNMTINKRKDFTGDTIEILAYASPQSFVGFAALDESIIRLYNGGNIITELKLYDELYSFDSNANTSFSQTWNAELGFASDRIFFPSNSYGFDAYSTFSYSGLILFTDLPVFDSFNESHTRCNASLGDAPCLDGFTCYKIINACDGVCQCGRDCYDETNCPEKEQFFRPLHERFYPKIERIFQLSWLWKDAFTLPDGRVQFRAEVSKDIANYVVSAFAMSRLSGFGVLKIPQRISTTRQFYIQVEMPPEARLGEQIGIRVDAFNFQSQRIEGLIILHSSEDYKFVNVERDGLVSSFAPKTTHGNHHVLLIIQPGTSRRIHIPIVATRAGQIEVKLEALSGANRDSYSNVIEVRYEGVTNTFHTPYLLSLVNMPRMISEFEIVTNQTYLLPLQQIWQYIPGSPRAQVFISGDVCGPFFYLGYDNFLSTDSYLKLSFASVEAGVFSFGTMIYNLMYMRQGHGGRHFRLDSVLKTLEWVNYEYLRILTAYDKNGFFTNFGVEPEPSVWLTAFAVSVIKDAVDPVWEQYSLFIDPHILSTSVIWLISQQNPINGSWAETGSIYDRKFISNETVDWDGSMIRLNLSLTAQCLIALKVNSDIRGDAAKVISNAINKGRMYLEQHFTKITDAFERSIVTYALHLTNSPIKDMAMQILNQTKFKNDYGIYWSNWEMPKMRIYWPSKNPRQNWKPWSNHEGYAVAATAYALLTHIIRADNYNKYEIMTWLQTQRNHIAGMASDYDTLLAHKALVLYAISTGDTIQNYNMNIKFTSSSSNDLDINYLNINDTNIVELQEYDINNVWGNLLVDGQGTGYALVQLRVQYNVEYPWLIRKPAYEAYNMTLTTHLYGRNFSRIDYDVCLQWLPQNSDRLYSNRSGQTQFRLQVPTGYRIEEAYLKTIFQWTANLGDGENAPGPELNFLFDYIDTTPNCFKFTLERYIPVANLSRYYEMTVFEYHEPQNANRSMYFLRDIFGLDICEVCGSYQCPYCPYYAFAFKAIQLNPFLILVSLIICFTITFNYFSIS